MIRAVIFDVGGPLDLETSFEAAIDADIRAGLQREGIAVSDESWVAAYRRAVERFAPNAYRAVIWQLSGNDREKSLRIYDRVEKRAEGRDLFELRPGIAGVLAALQTRGLKLGLAANQPAKALAALAEAGIGHYFENAGVSGVYGLRKPDPRFLLRVCGDLGVEPSECVLVRDRIDNDIAPAKLLGMRTVRILTGRHREQEPRSWEETPDAEVSDAAGILRAIEAFLDEA